MCKAMFIDICHAVAKRNVYFQRRMNAAGLHGFATVQKVTTTVCMLAYGGPADRLDEYFCMDETDTRHTRLAAPTSAGVTPQHLSAVAVQPPAKFYEI
jgi:hypothetical protein